MDFITIVLIPHLASGQKDGQAEIKRYRLKVSDLGGDQMLLPRMIDVFIGTAFLLINTAAYICSYYIFAYKDDDPRALHAFFVCMSNGYVQSILGFFSGLAISRITEVSCSWEPSTPEPQEEQVTLISKI